MLPDFNPNDARTQRACWIPTNDRTAPLCYTSAWTKGAILWISYTSRGGNRREVLAQVAGERTPLGAPTCELQLTEETFRKLEGPAAGAISVDVRRVA